MRSGYLHVRTPGHAFRHSVSNADHHPRRSVRLLRRHLRIEFRGSLRPLR